MWSRRAKQAKRARQALKTMSFVRGAGLGAALMYLLDPARGRRRRVRSFDAARHGLRQVRNELWKELTDTGNRIRGLGWRARNVLQKAQAPDDDVITERVRARLGRLCSHPGAIDVLCVGGEVELSGVVLKAEEARVLAGVERVAGVKGVSNRLAAYERSEHISSLQGGRRASGNVHNWRPRTRLAADATGLFLFGLGMRRRGAFGTALASMGLFLLFRATGNRPMLRLLGVGHDPHLIEIRKSIHVDAPIEEVYALFSAPESFPRFMSHVRSVEQVRDGVYRWTVDGPAGSSVSWDAEVTADVPNRLIAWRSTATATVDQAGAVHFGQDRRGGTRVDVQMFYNPPAGAIGHVFARMLGSDPRREMDDDLLRLKSLLEKGKATAHGQTVRREEILPVI